ncbi:MAG: hypothetical protein HON23_07520 [Rickettsiales bacterium]|nr:hypothetical protein [Rickettsiales bacterium]
MSRTMSDSSYWPKEKNLYVFSILFNYVTYGLLIISLCFSSLKYHAKKKHLELFLYILGIIAALYPTKNFTSPTYALGLMYFAIIFILFNLSQYNIAKKYYFAICGLLLLHILIPMGPKIGTHDGYRYYSGYLSEYTKLKPNEELIPRNRVGTNKIIANILLQEQKNVDFIYGDPARWLWTSFQFGIPVFLLEKGCHIISKEQIGCGNFSVTFTNKKSYTNFNNVTIKIPNDPSLSKVEAENTFLHNTITSLGLPPTYKLRKERNVKTNLKANKICFEEKNSAVLDYQPFNSKDYKFTAQIRLGKESKSDKLILQVDRHGPSPREGIGKIIKITPEFKSYELSHNFQKDHKYVRFVLKNPSNEKICFYIEDIEFLTTQNK